MKELFFALADAWMIFAGCYCGWKFIRRYGNYLLGLEWLIVGTSGTNFLLWSLLGGDQRGFLFFVAVFLDAFSRSVGITLILVMGLRRVTHRYKPSVMVEVGVFGLAVAAGLYLLRFHEGFHPGPATFYVVVNVLTTVFLVYFGWRLWQIGAKGAAITGALASAAGVTIAVSYDFFPIPDDQYRTTFYTLALATWGTQLFVYFHGYRALHDHNVHTGIEPASSAADEGLARRGRRP
jgi:hypothetical protein